MSEKTRKKVRSMEELEKAVSALEKGKAAAFNTQYNMKGRNIPMNRNTFNQAKGKIGNHLNKRISLEHCLNDDCRRYCQLVENPWDAPWKGVHNPLYPDAVGTKSSSVRMFGIQSFTVLSATNTTIIWSPNPGANEADGEVDGFYNIPAITHGGNDYGIPGCPTLEIGGLGVGKQGCCGWIRPNTALSTFDIQPIVGGQILGYDTPASAGAVGNATAEYAYRLVSAGWRLFNTSPNNQIGGTVASCQTPEWNTQALAGATTPFVSPTAHWSRMDGTKSGIYTPSERDISWSTPLVTGAVTATQGNLIRNNIQVQNGTANALSYDFVYIAYYEQIGTSQTEYSTLKRADPDEGAMIQYGIASYANNKNRAGSAGDKLMKKPITKHVGLAAAEKDPALSKILKGDEKEKLGGGESVFKSFLDGALPIAASLLTLL